MPSPSLVAVNGMLPSTTLLAMNVLLQFAEQSLCKSWGSWLSPLYLQDIFAEVGSGGEVQWSSVVQLEPNGDFELQLFQVLVACSGRPCKICGIHEADFAFLILPVNGGSLAVGARSIPVSGTTSSFSNSLTGLTWFLGESAEAGVHQSCTS